MKQSVKLRTLMILASLLMLGIADAFAATNTGTSTNNIISKFSFSDNASQNAEQDFLKPDEAFKLTISVIDAQTLQAQFAVAPTYYLYHDRIKFSAKNASITEVNLPKGEIKQDPNFGQMEVYHHDFIAQIRLANSDNNTAESHTATINATYQGCSEKGLCYAPIHKVITVNLVNNSLYNGSNSANDDQATSLLKGGKLWLIVAGFFGFGLLLALTPCVLPMIPILSGIIVGDKKVHHHATSRLHAFNLSLAYTLGMALSYTLAGVAAGLSGQLLSSALQSPWILSATALIFVALSFSMFGFYELRLPHTIESKMVNTANRLKGGQFMGVFIMGALSALIVSPCVAAPLAGALLYISQTHDVVLGAVALFALSIGMGVPLLLIGASAGHVLPKAGLWMTAVRNAFGVLMLAVAIYIVSPILPTSINMVLWAALLIIPAIYLHALDRLPFDQASGNINPWMKLWKGVGIMMLVLGIAQLIGAVSGAKSPLQPLSGLRIASANSASNISGLDTPLMFTRIKNTAELDAQLKMALGKTIMLDFYADWCVSCKEMEKFTFANSEVQQSLKNTLILQADVTANSDEDKALLKRFGLFGPPGIIFFDINGQELKQLKVIGFQDAIKFLITTSQLTPRLEFNVKLPVAHQQAI